jgi:GNAT superfamily N-acetyltransferase
MHMRSAQTSAPARATHTANGTGLARRWYYTPKAHRAYSLRQIAPGDRRLLAEFALALSEEAAARDLPSVRELSDLLFDRVLAGGSDMAVGFIALESTVAGDRVIGATAYAPDNLDEAAFSIAVKAAFRNDQVGRMLLASLIRHARRAGIRRLSGVMDWSNRPMQLLAQSSGFSVEALATDRGRRRLVLALRCPGG